MSGAAESSGASVHGAARTDVLVDNIATLVPKFAKIDCASQGDNTLVAAVSGKKIHVLAYLLGVSNTQQVRFKSGASTDLSGEFSFAQYGGAVAPFNQVGWFETVSGQALVADLGQNVQVSGHLTYIEVMGS